MPTPRPTPRAMSLSLEGVARAGEDEGVEGIVDVTGESGEEGGPTGCSRPRVRQLSRSLYLGSNQTITVSQIYARLYILHLPAPKPRKRSLERSVVTPFGDFYWGRPGFPG